MIKIKRFSVFNDSILKCNESVIDGDFIVKRLESANDFMRNDTSIRNMVDMNKSEEDLLIRLFGDYNMTKGMVPKVKVGNFYEDSGVCFAKDKLIRYFISPREGSSYFIKFEDDWWIVIFSSSQFTDDETAWLCDGQEGLELLSKYLHCKTSEEEKSTILNRYL